MGNTVTCVTDVADAKALWQQLSPNTLLNDDWKYRYLHYQYNVKPLRFYLLQKGGELVGLLPLQVRDDEFLEFFGGNKFYANQIFLKENNVKYYDELLASVKEPMHLGLLREPIPGRNCLEEDYGYYRLPLSGFSTWHEYIDTVWEGKSKKNLKRQMRQLDEMGITVQEDNWADLEILAAFNRKQFGERSHFNSPNRMDYVRDLCEHFTCKLMSVIVAGKVEAVGFAVLYNGVYYGLTSGHNLEINNLGKYLTLCRIEQAVHAGAKTYDAGRRDYGWKEHFHFEKLALFRLV